MRGRHSIDDRLTLLDMLALEHEDVAPFRHEDIVRDALIVGDDETLLALGVLTEADRPAHFGQYCRLLRLACLEQIRDPGQTAGDVTGLGGFLRHSRDDVADPDLTACLHGDDRT